MTSILMFGRPSTPLEFAGAARLGLIRPTAVHFDILAKAFEVNSTSALVDAINKEVDRYGFPLTHLSKRSAYHWRAGNPFVSDTWALYLATIMAALDRRCKLGETVKACAKADGPIARELCRMAQEI